MNRQDVIDGNIVDRYLLGQLDEHERDAFEVFYLSCPETVAELEVTEKLIAGFGASALGRRRTRSAAPRTAAATPDETESKRWNWPAIAASLVAVLAIGFGVQAERTIDAQRALLSAADINLPIVSLGTTRGDNGARLVMLPNTSTRVAFALDLGLAESAEYAVELLDRDGAVLWSARGLKPDDYESLTFSLPPGLLQAGEYELKAFPGDSPGTDLRFPILVSIDT